ncbi:MAG TPA: ABC transporter substrate-binding protein, partial [Clostridiales bacterium]|nr:ABC transporter substrate-binding protein [Clostridiales bacterium]
NSFVMLEFTNGFEVSDEDAAVAVGLKKGSDLTGKINEILAGISESQRQEIMDAAIGNQPSEQ